MVTVFNRFVLALLVLALMTQSGCRNRCGPWQPWRPFSQATIIPPPGTSSSRLSNATTPYYTANSPVSPLGAPTAFNGQPGLPIPAGNSLAAPGGSFSQGTMPPTTGFSNQQMVTSSTFGNSRVISPDFVTTQVDERLDPTRMPVADASRVRLPMVSPQGMAQTGNFIPGNVGINGSFMNPTQPAYQYSPQNSVLASSSTNPAYQMNYQNGWRPVDAGTLNR